MRLKIDWVNLQLGGNFIVSNLHEVFTETRLEEINLSKTQPCKLKTQQQIHSLKTQNSRRRVGWPRGGIEFRYKNFACGLKRSMEN